MKTKHSVLIVLIALLALAGCASVEKANTESLLSAAGFRVRTPDTAKQKEIYAALAPSKVQRATINGKVFYVYKDEPKGIAYVGREPEYQRYKQLAIEQRIAQDNYMAAEMNSMYSPEMVRGVGLSWNVVVNQRAPLG